MATFNQISAVGVLGAVIYYVLRAVAERKRMRGAKPPPGPKGWPIVGNAPELATSNGNLIPIFNRWAKQYGPITQFSILGEKSVVLSEDKIAHELFVKRGQKYSDRGTPHAMRYITENQNPALMPKNEAWGRERKLIHSAISITSNEQYQGFMADEATTTLHDLFEDPADFYNHFMRYSYSVLTRSILGFRIKSVSDSFIVEQEAFVGTALKCFRPDEYPSNVFPFLRHMPTWLVPSLKNLEAFRLRGRAGIQSLRSTIEASVRDGTASESIYRHFLENRGEYAVSDDEAGRTFESMIGGGTRSPHNALLAFCYLMMEYPEWMKKLQEELDSVVGSDRQPTFADVPNLPTVRAVVKEGVRYRTIVAELGIPHRLEEDDVYEGYFFPKGTVFHANYSAILMDKIVYPDQELFNPARWLESSYPTYKEPLSVHPNLQNFTPFGYGRRACPGYDFSERTLVIMAARLAWGFDIRWPIDPATKNSMRMELEYEPVPNPRPNRFPCEIVGRPGRAEVVRREAGKIL